MFLVSVFIPLLLTDVNFSGLILGLFPNPMPRGLIIFWTAVGITLLIFLITWSWQLHRTLGKKRQ